MNNFYFIIGPIAAGKSTFMEYRLYNAMEATANFFDHDKEKLMMQLYAPGEKKNLANALKNAIDDCYKHKKDFMIQAHFTNEQLPEINRYFHSYGNKFNMVAHFISVSDPSILKERADRRDKLGGHHSELKSIDKTYEQSYRNFITYLPKFGKATVWDNSKEYGINSMEHQFIYEHGVLSFKNSSITDYANKLLSEAQLSLMEQRQKLTYKQNKGISL
jgi:predicted ABC-type ATPase